MRAQGTKLSWLAFCVVALPTLALAQPLGDEFQVNTYTTGTQRNAAVARGPNGTFVVAWMGTEEGGPDAAGGHYPGAYGIFARRFDRKGNPLGTDFQVNTYTTGYQAQPSLAVAANGNFVVVWMSYGDGGTGNYDLYGYPIGGYGIVGRRFAANGTAIGGSSRSTPTPLSIRASPGSP